MSLVPQLMDDLKTAMRAKDDVARDTLRMLKSALQKKEMDLGRSLEGGEELAVLMSAAKSRRESVAAYRDGGRDDLATAEEAEIEIIERYLPKRMSEDDAKAAIIAIVTELGASEKKDMGKVMKVVLERHRGLIDGKLASKIAGSLLG